MRGCRERRKLPYKSKAPFAQWAKQGAARHPFTQRLAQVQPGLLGQGQDDVLAQLNVVEVPL